MAMETFNRRKKILDLSERLLSVEEDRLAGNKGYTISEIDKYLDDIISEDTKNMLVALRLSRTYPFSLILVNRII